MKNIKLNNLIRRFMVLAYITAASAGVTIGIYLPENWLWSILLVPLFTSFLLLLAYFINIWVEHRYVTYPFERTAQDTVEANKVLDREVKEMRVLYQNYAPEKSLNRIIHGALNYAGSKSKEIPEMKILYDDLLEELEFRKKFHEKEAKEKQNKKEEEFEPVYNLPNCPRCGNKEWIKVGNSSLVSCKKCDLSLPLKQVENYSIADSIERGKELKNKKS